MNKAFDWILGVVLAILIVLGVAYIYFNAHPQKLALLVGSISSAEVAQGELESEEEIDSSKPATILFVNTGDMMFDRGVRKAMAGGLDPFEFWSDLKEEVEVRYGANIDLLAGNLEGPITDNPVCQKKAYSFKFASTTGRMLRDQGFHFLSLANNHSNDCYAKGLLDTRENLKQAGIVYAGGGSIIDNAFDVMTVKGSEILMVGIDETILPIPLETFYTYIAQLKPLYDGVIVNIHWGKEYEKTETARQREIGRKLVDSGALAVIGHHPHVTEPMELYKDGVIFYSLGNFIFDQIGIEENRGGLAAIKFEISSTTKNLTIKQAEMVPFRIVNHRPCGVSCSDEQATSTGN
ncbi:MAG: CapA family protein [Patescibacteria group bacterium]